MTFKPRLLGVLILLGTLAVAFTTVSHQPRAEEPADPSAVVWDEQASMEVAHALHHAHELVNQGKFEEAMDMIAGDDVLVTFELSADDNSSPVALRSKKEVVSFMKQLFDGAAEADGVTVFLDEPEHRARATKNIGIVTEECTVRFRYENGEERVDKLFGTNVAVKHPDGWKFIQWHMSVAQPPKFYKNGSPIEKLTQAE